MTYVNFWWKFLIALPNWGSYSLVVIFWTRRAAAKNRSWTSSKIPRLEVRDSKFVDFADIEKRNWRHHKKVEFFSIFWILSHFLVSYLQIQGDPKKSEPIKFLLNTTKIQ